MKSMLFLLPSRSHLVAIVATLALTLGPTSIILALTNAQPQAAQSDPVAIGVVKDPIQVTFVDVNKAAVEDETGEVIYDVDPGETISLIYDISNTALVDYVVEVVPAITGNFQNAAPAYRLTNIDVESEVNPQGPAHILVEAGYTTQLRVTITFPKDTAVGTKAEVVLHANRTNCEQVIGCPWG